MNYLFTKTALLFFTQNLWRDEAFSYVLAKSNILEILNLTSTDFNPPLYYLLLHFWMMIFGTSEIALRSLSLLFFIGTIYLIFDILKDVFKIPLYRCIIYMGLAMMNPFLLTYAFEARMYMMVTFFVTLSYFALWTGRKKMYIVAITLALYTHYFSIFIFFVQLLAWLIKFISTNNVMLNLFQHLLKLKIPKLVRDDKFISNRVRSIKHFFLPIILFVPWVLFLISKHNFSDGSFWIIEPPMKDLFYLPFILYTGYERVFGEYYHKKAGYTRFHLELNVLLLAILAIAAMFATFKWIKKRHTSYKKPLKEEIKDFKIFDVLLWGLFPPYLIFAISFIFQPLFLPRYFIFASVGFLLLLFISIETIIQRTKKMKYLYLLTPIVILILLFKTTSTFNTLNLKYHSKRNVKQLYTEIQNLKKKSDAVYLTSELDYHLAMYYLKNEKNIYIFNKTHEEIPNYVGKVLIPPEVFVEVLPIYPKRAFVLYYSWYEILSTI